MFCNLPRTDRELSSLVESWQKLASSPHPRRGAGKGSLQERGRSSRVILGWSRRTIWGGGGRRGCPPSSPGCRSSRLRSAPLTSLFLLLLPASHTTLSQLPSDLSGAKVWSQSAGAGRPRPQGAHRAFSPSFSSFLERREPPRNPPGGQTEPVKTPADKLASPSIAPFRSGQVSLRPVTALPHQPGSPGSPAGSRFARLRLAPREGLPLCRVPAREPAPPPGLWGGASRQEGYAPAPGSSRESSPLLLPVLNGWRLVSKKHQFSAPSFGPIRPSPTREANWYRNSTPSLLSLF